MTFKRLALASTILGGMATIAAAEDLRFDKLYILGDSLSDAGTYSQSVIAGGMGALPAIDYKFLTNAPDGSALTYGEVLGRELGLSLGPNIYSAVPVAGLPQQELGGTIYAEGGARVSDPDGNAFDPALGITTRPLTEQVDRLLEDRARFDENDLLILWGGANDVFAQARAVGGGALTPGQAAANMGQAAGDLLGLVDRVRAAGAETVIVVTVPDTGTTPLGQSLGPQGAALQTALAGAFNDTLLAGIGGRAVVVDSAKLLSTVQADPVRYGFTAPNAASVPACPGNALICVQGLNASADSEERIFADGVHPTAAAHKLFGQAAFAGLQAATRTGIIPVATMTALRQHGLSIENRMNPTVLRVTGADGAPRRREVGEVDVFASLDIGSFEADAQQITPGLEGDTRVLKAGADIAVAPNATLGAGISLDYGEVDFDNDTGGFESDVLVGVVFGQVALSPNYYVSAAFGGGHIEVDEITRSFRLGAATERYTADTDGSYRFARIGGGGLYSLNPSVRLNPFAHYTWEKVSIDGFTESDGAASLSFGDAEYESKRVTAGLSAIFTPQDMDGWVFGLRGSVEHDLNDDPLKVSLGPSEDVLGTVSAPRPDRTWGYLSGSVVKDFGSGRYLSLTGASSVGLDGARGFTGAVSYKMTF
ncbi:autotransporter domain-containing protein [Marivita sp. GX14005]|uniref:autotransporter domain-containing protein n=1 Tax=Marivita sp. GX14005 TaxID=2942276 RepID=UPI0020189278|nr:autotransporter domain-containing protein [Marivita sp. GX14005]MCL3882445.1 autotransporter domain-containing protein [Marivita sp. GX14005]